MAWLEARPSPGEVNGHRERTSLLSEALATAQVTGHFLMSSLSCSETLPFALALSIAA